jgi:VIT1/CCC1 family predicted Fe2+/Mn2+ transporter
MTNFRDPINHTEHHNFNDSSKLNWLRAAVLGANDGVVSVASIVLGVAGATSQTSIILTSGIAGLVAGALSMAVGEYVSVSTQRDTEKAFIEKEKWELENEPEHELEELTKIYEIKGLSRKTAEVVAKELTEKDVLKAHLRDELNIDAEDLTNPVSAASASGLAFVSGGIIPVLSVLIAPEGYKIIATFVSVILALILTGVLSAHAGGADKTKATVRVVVGGVVAMLVTYLIGSLFGVNL